MTSSTINNNNNNKNNNINSTTISQRIYREIHHKPAITDLIPRKMISCDKNVVSSINEKTTQNYYQVATPKSPRDFVTLSSNDDLNVDSFRYDESSENRTSNLSGSFSNQSIPNDNTTNTNKIKDSEETERFKYNMIKSELLDIVHSHSLLTHKEVDNIRDNIKCIEAQINLLNHMHKDNTLSIKIENYQKERSEINKKILHAKSIQEKWKDHVFPNGSTPQNYLMTGSIHIPKHHYQTRSKSHGNLLDNTELFHPTDDSILNGRSNKRQKLSPDNLEVQTKRIVSFNNSPNTPEIPPKSNNFEPIFRRYDGILVIITCSFCQRDNFTSAQGIVNHTRLKHHKTYSSQPLAILFNQVLLSDDKQDPEILKKFNSLKLNPHKEYLPYDIAIPSMTAPPRKGKSKMTRTGSDSMKNKIKEVNIMNQAKMDTTHLRTFYPDNDFDDLVHMVDNSKKDLQTILDIPTDDESEIDEEIDKDDVSKDEDFTIEDGVGKGNSDESDSSDYVSDEDEREETAPTESSPIEQCTEKVQPQRKTRTRRSYTETVDETKSEAVGSRLRSRLQTTVSEEAPADNVSKRLRNTDADRVSNKDNGTSELGNSTEKSSLHYNLRLRSKTRQTAR
ncbi:hypothetical protein C6P45_003246 [Maudiozyma exigua]|uniref:Protein AHC1 n=1 Tax=Maudiozyma exigua TaxID=34358 RepID=A0A9P6WCI0_MAUEX|nr:hypothetical protein C6P45_003246 [Kazachstania exigua]